MISSQTCADLHGEDASAFCSNCPDTALVPLSSANMSAALTNWCSTGVYMKSTLTSIPVHRSFAALSNPYLSESRGMCCVMLKDVSYFPLPIVPRAAARVWGCVAV